MCDMSSHDMAQDCKYGYFPFSWNEYSFNILLMSGAVPPHSTKMNPKQGSCVPMCVFPCIRADFYVPEQPFHVALRVGALPLWCGAHLQLSRATQTGIARKTRLKPRTLNKERYYAPPPTPSTPSSRSSKQ